MSEKELEDFLFEEGLIMNDKFLALISPVDEIGVFLK
jgi:hypothetical protein